MNKTASTQEFQAAEAALRAGGIGFTVVRSCPDVRCRWCRATPLATAA